MVNDRVNCNEVYYFLDIQSLYNLTTFFVFAEVYSQIFVLSSNLGGGTECWVKWCAQN